MKRQMRSPEIRNNWYTNDVFITSFWTSPQHRNGNSSEVSS